LDRYSIAWNVECKIEMKKYKEHITGSTKHSKWSSKRTAVPRKVGALGMATNLFSRPNTQNQMRRWDPILIAK